MTDWSILGGNPAPGTPETFDAVAGVLGPIVEASEGSSTTIHTIAQQAGSLVWSGVAADAFAESVRAIPIDLAELATAHQTAVRALGVQRHSPEPPRAGGADSVQSHERAGPS